MANYSGFLSNFVNTVSNVPSGFVDILSSAVTTTSQYNNNGTLGTYNATYFYLGNLLIQYSNVGGSTPVGIQLDKYCTITFPIPYTIPPTVFIAPWTAASPLGITQTTTTSFEVQPGTNNNFYPNWLAIGLSPNQPAVVPVSSYIVNAPPGSYTVESNSSFNTIITFLGNSSTISFGNNGSPILYACAGAGGNGFPGVAGGGGGGGEVIYNPGFTVFQTTNNTLYTINVAQNNSETTSIIGNEVIATANSGSNGIAFAEGVVTGGKSGNGNLGGLATTPLSGVNTGGGGGGSASPASTSTGGNGTNIPGFSAFVGLGGNGGTSTISSTAPSGLIGSGTGGGGGNSNGIGGTGGSGVVILFFNM